MSSNEKAPGAQRTLTDVQDKAFKRQALDLAKHGGAPGVQLRQWLSIYHPPPTVVRPPVYVAGAAVMARMRERDRARKERVNRLMRLREGWGNVRGVIRMRPCPSPKKATAEVKKVLAEREEEQARKARVQVLMNLRYGKSGAGDRGKSGSLKRG
ncbi:hypothetical protein DFH09DRAFT_1343672 [Mycena vulgaris]|nr:hypothetical protein DFH09DRAFT_1343672 [Mycena vulgaris]